jgi:hypothetical protein
MNYDVSEDTFVLGVLLVGLFLWTNLAIAYHVDRIAKILHGHREDELSEEKNELANLRR